MWIVTFSGHNVLNVAVFEIEGVPTHSQTQIVSNHQMCIRDRANLDFKASPTCAEFMKSESFGRLIAGPVGSGKTTACVIELLRRAVLQTPAKDVKRYTRFAIVRQTLKQLRDTVLKDAQQWLGHLGYWKVSESCFHLEFDDVVSELIFIPLEDAADQARLLSMQLTGAWLSEAIEMNYDVVGPVSGRIGRFPSGIQGTPTWSGIICDTNFPTELTPWHKFMTEPLSNWQIFTQPSGLAPNAENLNYLVQNEKTILLPINHPDRIAQGRRYYERFVETYGENSDWVDVYKRQLLEHLDQLLRVRLRLKETNRWLIAVPHRIIAHMPALPRVHVLAIFLGR